MAQVIVEMEMPQTCTECPIGNYFHTNCPLQYDDKSYDQFQAYRMNERPSWCPIKGVLPDEHGDLIDRDALLETCIYYYINPNKGAVDSDNIQDMPVIIAAERKDDENH